MISNGDQIFYLKSFDFILSLSCSDTNIFYCKLALPTEYIMNSFTDEEKENFYRILQNANNKRYEFFQVAQIYA